MTRRSKSANLAKPRKYPANRDADATRARILKAARLLFSRNSYDGVGIREIAAEAGTDPALPIRYFGSKEGLLREVAARAFGTEDFFNGDVSSLPEVAAGHLLGELNELTWRTGYDPFRLLLFSLGSETAGPILAEYLDKDFITPLAAALKGKLARERAVMLAAHILGLALTRVALSSRGGERLQKKVLHALLVKSLQAAIAPEGMNRP